MKIIEKFNSIQGEGNSQGKNSLFIRFFGCNLKCFLCDSIYALDNSQTIDIPDEDIFKEIEKVNNVVFTGGEPLLPSNLFEIKKILNYFEIQYKSYNTYEIETNGTIKLDNQSFGIFYDLMLNNQIQFNISPKGNFEQEKQTKSNNLYLEPVLIEQLLMSRSYIVKYLFKDENDFRYIKDQQEKYNILPELIYLQPIGTDVQTIKELILKYFDQIIENGWNISMRSHIWLFGNERGV